MYANSSTVVLDACVVSGNTAQNVGGCAVKATDARGMVVAGSTFDGNVCQGDGSAIVGGNFASSTCYGGGASLMVESSLPSLEGGDATLCGLAPKHLVHISSSAFRDDLATPHSCGGAIMTSQAWLELHNSVITGPGVTNAGAGSAIASASSAIVLQDSRISNHRALANGGAFFQLRGRLWVTNCSLTDSHVTSNDGGGCMYVRDALGVKLSGCLFDLCTSPAGGGALNIQTLLEDIPITPVLTIQDTTISRARSMRDGAALTSLKLDLVVTDTVFEHNQVCAVVQGFQGSCLVPASTGSMRTTCVCASQAVCFPGIASPHTFLSPTCMRSADASATGC